MSKDNGFILYACPICKVLLIVIEEKHLTYRDCTLDDDGEYTVQSIVDELFDQYLCPECSTGSEHPDELGHVLTKIHFHQTETAALLNKLVLKLQDDSQYPMYGISLDSEELKAIIMEDSIGN